MSYTTAVIPRDQTRAPATADELGLEGKPSERKWKFRAHCATCSELIEEGRETPRGLIPTGHIVNGGLQCDPCYQKHEAHKAE